MTTDPSPYAAFNQPFASKRERFRGSKPISAEPLTETKSATQRGLEEPPRSMPAWLSSLIIHLIVLLVLVLIPQHRELLMGISLTGSFGDLEGDASFDLQDSAELEASMAESEVAQIEESTKVDVATFEPQAVESLTPISIEGLTGPESAITLGVSGRSGSMKDALLKAFGGTQGTQDSVKLGLNWLAKQQQRNGSWSLIKPYTTGGMSENPAAATAMAMLAFLGDGNTHLTGEYKEQVKKGLYFLRELQDSKGFFARSTPNHQRMYAQAQCTMVVCELYAMTKDPSIRELAEDAIQFAIDAQSTELGGWRYEPREDSDVSMTGWFVMALMSGRMAGIEVSGETLNRIGVFLDGVQHEEGAFYGYAMNEQGPRLSMTAEGLLCRQYLGWKPYHKALRIGAEELLNHPIEVTDDADGKRAYYYWYYATQVLHHMGGEHWAKWNAKMRVALPAMQIQSGKEAGSWSPSGEQWGAAGGRLYSTCMSLYCLEVYYRHLPLYNLK